MIDIFGSLKSKDEKIGHRGKVHLAYPASLQHSTQIYNSDSHIPNRAQQD